MPSIAKIAASYLALAAATFLTGARAAAIQGVEIEKYGFQGDEVEKCGFKGPILSPSPPSDATKRQEPAENVASLSRISGPPLAAGEEEPRPKNPEDISGKPPPSDDGRVLDVGVYMHVVGISDKRHASDEFFLSRGDLDRQIDALNKSYKQANVSFQLLDADWTNDDFLGDVPPARAYRAFGSKLALGLHKGNISTLNIFFIDYPFISLAGTSSIFIETDEEKFHGIIVGINTVPGGSHPIWNLGVTAVHEAGHWFGLDHTDFIEPGDCEPNWLKKDGRSNEPCGARCDANIMSYGADACLAEFTPK